MADALTHECRQGGWRFPKRVGGDGSEGESTRENGGNGGAKTRTIWTDASFRAETEDRAAVQVAGILVAEVDGAGRVFARFLWAEPIGMQYIALGETMALAMGSVQLPCMLENICLVSIRFCVDEGRSIIHNIMSQWIRGYLSIA